jgi:hypothetical protein
MNEGPDFSMPSRLELRWKSGSPTTDISGRTFDISGAWDISGNDCCSQITEIDGYVKRIVSILNQVNARGDIETADQRFGLLISTLTARLGQL